MKKVVIFWGVIVFCFSASAEIYPFSFGFGFHSGSGSTGAELSLNTGFDGVSRGECDIGISWNENKNWGLLDVKPVYQWHWYVAGGFNWFVGPLMGVGYYWGEEKSYIDDGFSDPYWDENDITGFYWGLGGQIGLEYDLGSALNIPLIFSVDVRPVMNFIKPKNMDFFFFVVNIGVKLGVFP